MKRKWAHTHGHPGTGTRFADALGCVSQEEYVSSILDVHHLVTQGVEVRITAEFVKLDAATGEPLEDHREVGDYVTTGYLFETMLDAPDTDWVVERQPNMEGEQSAADYATALGMKADRDFCESALQLKAALDRFRGRCYIKPVIHEGIVVGLAYEYQHLAKEDRAAKPPTESGPHGSEEDAPGSSEDRPEPPEDQSQDDADSSDTASEEEEADHSEADREALEAIEARA